MIEELSTKKDIGYLALSSKLLLSLYTFKYDFRFSVIKASVIFYRKLNLFKLLLTLLTKISAFLINLLVRN